MARLEPDGKKAVTLLRGRDRAAMVAAFVLALPATAAAEPVQIRPVERSGDDNAEEIGETSDRRTLNGHLFAQARMVEDPFTSTYVQLSLGVAIADGTGPLLDLDTGRVADRVVESDLVGAQQAATLQIGVTDWWALRAGFTSTIYAGRTAPAFLAVGAVGQVRGSLGMTLSHGFHRTLRIGVVGEVQGVMRELVNVIDAVEASIETGDPSDFRLVNRTDTVTYGGGLSAAWAPHEALGLVVTGRYLFDDVVTGVDAEEDTLTIAVAGDLDLRAFSTAPLTLLGAYRLDEPIDSDLASRSHRLEVDLYYTRGSELVVGPGFEARWFDLRPNLETRSFAALLDLYYYW
jgi:hypothetical protein